MLGTLAWYLVSLALSGPGVAGYVLPVSAAWSLAAGAAGAAFGLAGALWRDGNPAFRATSIALLAGALAGEAWLLLGEWTGRAARLVLALELLAALTALLLARRRTPVVLTLALFLVAAVGIAGLSTRPATPSAWWAGTAPDDAPFDCLPPESRACGPRLGSSFARARAASIS